MSEFISEAKLPVELLLLVKEHKLLSDLRTHVCFYNTCRTIAAFYGDNSQQNAFWRRACALSGIGWLRGDSSWKEIAFETIAKDGFCTHSHCGATLLGWNGKSQFFSVPSFINIYSRFCSCLCRTRNAQSRLGSRRRRMGRYLRLGGTRQPVDVSK